MLSSVPETGLFRGFRERSDNSGEAAKVIKLILLGVKDKENDLKALNMAVFNVLSIKLMYGDTKELCVFKQSEADQTAAVEILEEAFAEFQKDKRMVSNDPEIIDVSTMDDVPDEFFSPKKKETKTNTGTTHNYGYGCGYQNNDWKKKQEEREKQKAKEEKMRWTPFLIKRKGDLPQLKTLNALKKKVVALAAGEYEEAHGDPDPKDTFEEKKTTGTTA